MNEQEELQEVYDRLLTTVSELVQDFDPMAAVMMTQSLSIYKTALPPDNFNLLVDSILSKKDRVKKFSDTTEILH